MEKCDICGNELLKNSATYETDNNEEVRVCKICENHIDTLQNSNNIENLKESKSYFSPYIKELANEEVLDFLKDIIKIGTSFLKESKQDEQSNISKNYHNQSNIRSNITSWWIRGMRIFAWIAFFGIIIIGLVISVPFWEDNASHIGFVIIMGSFIAAFLLVAILMIFLEMAEDIKEIRYNTKKK